MGKIIKAIPKPIKLILKPLYLFYMGSKLRNLITLRKSRANLYNYWLHPNDGYNSPEDYIYPTERSAFLFGFIKKYVKPEEKILEIGCNVGRNLNYLFNVGYKNLDGIEISKEAISLMEKVYPEMAGVIKVYGNSVEEVIKSLKENSYYAVFTMAVLQHIHPDSEFVFSEIARITKKYLIIVEDEKGVSSRHFVRDYKKIFENLGMKQIEQFNCNGLKDLGSTYWVRVFIK